MSFQHLLVRTKTKSGVAFYAGLGTGLLLAMPLVAPVFEVKLPEFAATMWGNGLGSFVAVAGALYLYKLQDEDVINGKQEIALALLSRLQSQAELLLPETNNAVESEGIVPQMILDARFRIRRTKKQLADFRATLGELGFAIVKLMLDVEDTAVKFKKELDFSNWNMLLIEQSKQGRTIVQTRARDLVQSCQLAREAIRPSSIPHA